MLLDVDVHAKRSRELYLHLLELLNLLEERVAALAHAERLVNLGLVKLLVLAEVEELEMVSQVLQKDHEREEKSTLR